MTKFPCPYCKGKGGWQEVILDFGQGTYFECGTCNGEGMIVVDSKNHQKLNSYRRYYVEHFAKR